MRVQRFGRNWNAWLGLRQGQHGLQAPRALRIERMADRRLPGGFVGAGRRVLEPLARRLFRALGHLVAWIARPAPPVPDEPAPPGVAVPHVRPVLLRKLPGVAGVRQGLLARAGRGPAAERPGQLERELGQRAIRLGHGVMGNVGQLPRRQGRIALLGIFGLEGLEDGRHPHFSRLEAPRQPPERVIPHADGDRVGHREGRPGRVAVGLLGEPRFELGRIAPAGRVEVLEDNPPGRAVLRFVIKRARHAQDPRGLGRDQVAADGPREPAEEALRPLGVIGQEQRLAEEPVGVEPAPALDDGRGAQGTAGEPLPGLRLRRRLEIHVHEEGAEMLAMRQVAAELIAPRADPDIHIF